MSTESTSHVNEGVGEDQVNLKNADNDLRLERLNTYNGLWRVMMPRRSLDGSLPHNLSDRIPLEIIESIIDCMVQTTLVPTAQVCRAWYPRAMYNLYSAIRLQSRRCYNLLVQQVRTSPRVKQRLATTDGLIVRHFMKRKGDTIPFLDALPLVLADALSSLRVLSIEGGLRAAMHPTFYLGLLQFKHIVSLRLCSIRLSNIKQLQQIVYACPHVAELGLHHVTLMKTGPVGRGSSRPAHIRSRTESTTSLRRLDIKAMDGFQHETEYLMTSVSIIDWLVSSTICTSLRDLEWDVGNLAGMARAGIIFKQLDRLLEATGTSLSSFNDKTKWDMAFVGYESYISVLNLVHSTALRDLACTANIDTVACKRKDGWSVVASYLCRILSTVRSYQLQRIMIDIYFGPELATTEPMPFRAHWEEEEEEKEEVWGRRLLKLMRDLHSVMVQPYFGALTAVHVAIEYALSLGTRKRSKGDAHDAAEAIEVIQQLLGPWHERGLVKVSHTTKIYYPPHLL
ncbi:hypothetical protein EVJ58_g1153 [Rhodofomes roseus]|uniref:F-box domain-containing protein n=1 Tax=Rhodofomes roseus TaxID=34475 RepID=A0A4Y9Z2R2_9APHY|nr:hypothetical protein EVJ58_g1153 [Rhodofomes roseus]